MAARGALLKYLKVNVTSVPRNPTSAAGGYTSFFSIAFNAVRRRFSTEELRGSFLDKSEVSDRVVSIVKNFQKVDPSQLKIDLYVVASKFQFVYVECVYLWIATEKYSVLGKLSVSWRYEEDNAVGMFGFDEDASSQIPTQIQSLVEGSGAVMVSEYKPASTGVQSLPFSCGFL
ncbi:hypothetical protein LWI29_026381 [Acer saccharum]|uniref:Uncharacterized protein n=1 Tax=Acer saccharum TaxID=4024 RepID=A0AA39VNY9_ACESA|nr:hypothetical protein LWI29_026381 [Acer saccharum]